MCLQRRLLLLGGFCLTGAPAWARSGVSVEAWRDPNCGCCGGWVRHMRAAGFAVRETVTPALGPVRAMLGTPADLLSCHAARVDGFALEGHVPAPAVHALLERRPRDVRGLAVPEMPIGSPGMEVAGQEDDAFDVIAFGRDGVRRVFMRFRGITVL